MSTTGDAITEDKHMSDAASEQTPVDRSPEAARREVLKRLGVYGAFVAPALLTALSSTASAQVLVDSGATN
jgi:hypothetical protein